MVRGWRVQGTVAHARPEDNGPLAVIDLSMPAGALLRRLARGYGVAGSTALIARSFTELVASLVESRRGRRCRMEPGWVPLGGAYD